IQDGTLRALAIANEARSPSLPQVATMAELGFSGFELSTWYGISAPAGTPRGIVDGLAQVIGHTPKSAAVKEKISKAGAEIFFKDANDYATYVQQDATRLLPLIES